MRRPKFTDEGRISAQGGSASEETADKSIAVGVKGTALKSLDIVNEQDEDD